MGYHTHRRLTVRNTMAKIKIEDLMGTVLPDSLTSSQLIGVSNYLKDGTIPAADPCIECEPNYIRKLISAIQVHERTLPEAKPVTEVAEPEGYVIGDPGPEEVEKAKKKRPEMFKEKEADK